MDDETAVLGPSATEELRELQAQITAKEEEYNRLNARHTELWQQRKAATLDRDGYIDYLMVSDRMEVLLKELEAAKPVLLYQGKRLRRDSGPMTAVTQQYTACPSLLNTLRNVIEGFKRVIADLRQEITRISQVLSDWADALPGFDEASGGFDEGDFEVDDNGVPQVEVPDVLGDEPFDENHNPYDKYADEVIEGLTWTLNASRDGVENRAEFMNIFTTWRINIRALEIGLSSRATIDQKEYGAFLSSIQKVLSFVQRFVDDKGWFRDSPIDLELRELVDEAFGGTEAAERLKAALNVISRISSAEEAAIFGLVFTLREIGVAIEQHRMDQELEQIRQELEAQEQGLLDSVLSFVDKVSSIGWEAAVALTPLGDVIDFCEAVSGKEGCHLLSGRDLSYEARAFAAVGILMWGSPAAVRRLADKLDTIKCRPRPHLNLVSEPTSAPEQELTPSSVAQQAVVCDARTFFPKLEKALDDVPKQWARQHVVREITHWNGSLTLIHENGWRVTYNKRGFPVFNDTHMWPVPEQAQVWVDFYCNSAREFDQANRATRLDNTPGTHTWHHSHRFQPRGNRVQILMQLIEEPYHRWASHAGGMAIGRRILGHNNCR